jgi:hypothetical protein
MPKVCSFYGIKIYIYWDDHPRPHFHAKYGGQEMVVAVNGLKISEGSLPHQATRLVMKWAKENLAAIKRDCDLAEKQMPVEQIPPLR